ncbi:hypothetical protein GX408_17765 [bacterium]|nr:hypothetical protein [bacterium]
MKEQTSLHTDQPIWNTLYPAIREFFRHNYLDIVMDAKKIRGYRSPDARSIWIRDHSDMMRCTKYFETDLTSCIDHFAETQAQNGRIFDYYTVFPEKLPSERENWAKYVRVPVEADVEYRFVKAAYLAWQAAGDDTWLAGILPCMEKAMQYILTHPWRWDSRHQLVKRPYTIDTWDFAYSAGQHDWLQMQIDENTFWGIMHGDNSGYYEAMMILSQLYAYFGKRKKAAEWLDLAKKLRRRMNRICWNGRFYTHFIKLTPVTIPGVDEAEQLSLSNPMDINRGVADHGQAVSIIREYQSRKKKTNAFAEWFSIDPPFPDGCFGDELLVRGAYCNGGIMPLVGGELARAALEHGFESYGVAILRQYAEMIARDKATYLWYFPDGRNSTAESSTSPEALPTDGWGSGAMAYALIEGLAGVVDRQKSLRKITLCPRWPSAGVAEARIHLHYPASDAFFGYDYRLTGSQLLLDVNTHGSDIQFHIQLPAGKWVRQVLCRDRRVPFHQSKVEATPYVDFSSHMNSPGSVQIVFI